MPNKNIENFLKFESRIQRDMMMSAINDIKYHAPRGHNFIEYNKNYLIEQALRNISHMKKYTLKGRVVGSSKSRMQSPKRYKFIGGARYNSPDPQKAVFEKLKIEVVDESFLYNGLEKVAFESARYGHLARPCCSQFPGTWPWCRRGC